jgi:triacylglycerol lipase
MSWCRANIGIGTDFAEPLSAYEPAPDLTLPFSLKNPILSRAQVEAAKRLSDANKAAKDRVVAERVRQGNFPGLPYSLGTSLTAYLLDLLDSPAYANLTPSFLQDVFNPATPDRDDIKYYSIAARTRKISILHPLWVGSVLQLSYQAC